MVSSGTGVRFFSFCTLDIYRVRHYLISFFVLVCFSKGLV